MPKVPLQSPEVVNQTTFPALLRENFEAIEAAFDNTLSLDGDTPNQLMADLDLNSNFIINAPTPTADGHITNKGYVDTLVADAVLGDISSLVQYTSEKGVANGYASLDGSSLVPVAQIPDLSSTYVNVSQKGANDGVATLDSSGKIPASQIPDPTLEASTTLFTGDGTTTAFVISDSEAATVNQVNVYLGGSKQPQTTTYYDVTNDGTDATVTFVTAPLNGTQVLLEVNVVEATAPVTVATRDMLLNPVITGSLTADMNTIYPVNTTSGAIVVTLPAHENDGRVIITDADSRACGTNTCSVTDGTDTWTMTYDGAYLELGSKNGLWIVIKG